MEQVNRIRGRLSCRLRAGSIECPALTCVAQGMGLQEVFYGSFRANERSRVPPGPGSGQSAPSAHPNLEPSNPCPLPGQPHGQHSPTRHSQAAAKGETQVSTAFPEAPSIGRSCPEWKMPLQPHLMPTVTPQERGVPHRLPPGLTPWDSPLGRRHSQ